MFLSINCLLFFQFHLENFVEVGLEKNLKLKKLENETVKNILHLLTLYGLNQSLSLMTMIILMTAKMVQLQVPCTRTV